MPEERLTHDFPITIVGVGAVGRRVAEHVMTGQCGDVPYGLTFIDDDIVEPSNVGRQHYTKGDIGYPKVMALARMAHSSMWNTPKPTVRCERFIGLAQLKGIVIICVDNMRSRQSVYISCKDNPEVPLLIDTRTDAIDSTVICIDPCNKAHQAGWERNWFPDEKMVNLGAGCGLNPLPGGSATTTAGLATSLLVRHGKLQQGWKGTLENFTWFRNDPFKLEVQNF
jgi:hypothetical protein